MKNATVKNFHVPMPPELHADLMQSAQVAGESATSIAREAIAQRVKELKRQQRRERIALYAAEMAGTDHDLNPDWEEAGLELWRKTE